MHSIGYSYVQKVENGYFRDRFTVGLENCSSPGFNEAIEQWNRVEFPYPVGRSASIIL